MNELFAGLKVSATALEAQKLRMNVIASNIANVGSTTTPEGGPYRRRDVKFESYFYDNTNIGVNVPKVVEDMRPFKRMFDPSHPDADKDGYVSYPNINGIEETVNMMSASRSYEANLLMITTFKEMYMRTLDITKV